MMTTMTRTKAAAPPRADTVSVESELLHALDGEQEDRRLLGDDGATPPQERRRARQPTPRAAIARSLATAKVSRERLIEVGAWAGTAPLACAFIGAGHALLREAQWGSEITNEAGLLRFLNEEDRPALVTLLASANIRLVELAAYAVVAAATEHPEWFGRDDHDDPAESAREKATVKARRDAALVRLTEAVRRRVEEDPVLLIRPGADLRFAFAPDVTVFPLESVAERLMVVLTRPAVLAELRSRGRG
jgi:hypothetical protein